MALVDAVTGVRKAARKVIDTAIARGTMVAALEGDFYLRLRDAMRLMSARKGRRP
jgi:hypothetical protein